MAMIVPTVLEVTREAFLGRLLRYREFPSASEWQVDVLDGSYAGAIAFSDPESLDDYVKDQGPEIELDLMTQDPLRHIDLWSEHYTRLKRVIIHVEAVSSPMDTLATIMERHPKLERGLAVALDTPLTAIDHLVPDITHLQIMGVPVGASGQRFAGEPALSKIQEAHYLYPELTLSVDGGVTIDNANDCLLAGASQLCVNSALWKSKDPLATLKHLQTL